MTRRHSRLNQRAQTLLALVDHHARLWWRGARQSAHATRRRRLRAALRPDHRGRADGARGRPDYRRPGRRRRGALAAARRQAGGARGLRRAPQGAARGARAHRRGRAGGERCARPPAAQRASTRSRWRATRSTCRASRFRATRAFTPSATTSRGPPPCAARPTPRHGWRGSRHCRRYYAQNVANLERGVATRLHPAAAGDRARARGGAPAGRARAERQPLLAPLRALPEQPPRGAAHFPAGARRADRA